ncbi:MAG TPA: FAD-dependent oxidoreductase [Syntrophorhabdaceae bacterium]|nr:FAD-dependent oxidoreductase [Syntrophorhabdaceae bacterium]
MKTDKSSRGAKLETDIVIIGGGGGGLAAAVAAAEKGARVIVLEKRHTLGGNSVFAEGLFAAESPVQQRSNIDARRDKLFRQAMDFAHWKLDPKIIRAFIDKSGDTIRWFEEKGLNFFMPALYFNQVPLVWHCLKKGGATVVKQLTRDCEDLGVRIVRDAAVKKILVNEKGEIRGVTAQSKAEEFQASCKAVVIATGGFGGNKELLKKYCPTYTENDYNAGLPHTGDGLTMAMDVGAATEGLGLLHLGGPRSFGPIHVTAVAQEFNTIWVNKKGERFTDETITDGRGNTVHRQPDKVSYSIFDEKIKQGIITEGLIKGVGAIYVPQRTKLPHLDKLLRDEAEQGRAIISDSWGKIAAWIGVDTQTLTSNIREYNSFCSQGYDEHFNKDRRYLSALQTPPYYAVRCHSAFLGTIGGIKINYRMEVLNHEDTPIPGLYGVGADTGGWEWDTYNILLSGSTFGFAINSGRIAGENAVHYASIKRKN